MTQLEIRYPDGHKVLVLLDKPEMVIGRDPSCDIPLDDAITSRRHAVLRRETDGRFTIEDLKSKNGTTLNDQSINAGWIREGDRIGIGTCYLSIPANQKPTITLSDTDVESFGFLTTAWQPNQPIVLPQQRLEKLYELNKRLTGKFDRDALLGEVLDICMELLRFERAGIGVGGDGRGVIWVALKNLAATASGEFQISRSIIDRVLEDGQRLLIGDPAGTDPTASMVAHNIRSAMCVPILWQNRVRGVIYGDRVTTANVYTQEDTHFFAALGELAGLGLANAQLAREMQERQRMDMELQWTREIQTYLFPPEPIVRPGVHIAALNDPSRRISGDYYDYFLREDGLITVVISDVSGKGIPASLLAANLQAAVHLILSRQTDLGAAVADINRLVCENVRDSGRFITGVFALLDPKSKTLSYVNAGHPQPFVIQPDGTVRPLSELSEAASAPTRILGDDPAFRYQSEQARMPDGPSTILMYTDGITEAMSDGDEQFGENRLKAFLEENADRPPEELMQRVRATARQFTRNRPQTDDITLLAMQIE